VNYLRSVLAGVAAAIIAIAIWTIGGPAFINWHVEPPPGGMVAFLVTPSEILIGAGIGFALGFWWSVRRQRRRVRA
jgi:hypothetical protein